MRCNPVEKSWFRHRSLLLRLTASCTNRHHLPSLPLSSVVVSLQCQEVNPLMGTLNRTATDHSCIRSYWRNYGSTQCPKKRHLFIFGITR